MLDQQTVQELADQAFGRWAMAVPSEEWLSTSGVTHQPTLDFLRAVGVPVQARIYDDGTFVSRPATKRGSFVEFGYSANCDAIYLDPQTGVIHGFFGDVTKSYVYCSSVAHLVYFAAYWELHGKLNGVWLDEVDEDEEDAAYDAADAIGRHFAEIDPGANTKSPGEEDTLWESIASDGFASGLFAEWGWSGTSIEYFRQRGIDPLAMTPYREPE